MRHLIAYDDANNVDNHTHTYTMCMCITHRTWDIELCLKCKTSCFCSSFLFMWQMIPLIDVFIAIPGKFINREIESNCVWMGS